MVVTPFGTRPDLRFWSSQRRENPRNSSSAICSPLVARESTVRIVLNGLLFVTYMGERAHESRPLADHISDWQADLIAKGFTAKHAEHTSNRARRLVALMLGSDAALLDHRRLAPSDRGDVARKIAAAIAQARLSDLTRQKVQDAIAQFQGAGSSLQTCNHYRAAIRAFSKWCYDTDRTRDDSLHGVKGFNAREDRRHDRRTISLEELRLLTEATQRGQEIVGMTGPARALCYRLAVATGLRYAEISSITTGSFDWKAPSVTVAACYTKNGHTATLPLQDDLVGDLASFVAELPPGSVVFPVPTGKGAKMLRYDLKAAGIPYRDESGLVYMARVDTLDGGRH